MKKELKHLGDFCDFTDGTIKSVYENNRGIIETTLLVNKKNRGSDVYCVPTHHYCNLGCVMCHLTKEGYRKPMIPIGADNLLESIVRTRYDKDGNFRTGNKNGWLSFMGVGEPLLNKDLMKGVFECEDELKEACGYENMTYAFATMMPNSSLVDFADYVDKNNMPLKVHFSMHSPFTDERLDLLPSTKVGIDESLELLSEYRNIVSQNKRIIDNFSIFHSNLDPTEIHYTLIENQNDTDRHLDKMIELLDVYRIPFKILTFNPTGDMKRSKREDLWVKTLQESLPGLKIKLYNPPGHEVGSSCGEFTKHYYLSDLESNEEKEEFLRWKKKHQI